MPRDPRQYQGSNPRLREQTRGLVDSDRTCDPGCGDESVAVTPAAGPQRESAAGSRGVAGEGPEWGIPATASPDRIQLELQP